MGGSNLRASRRKIISACRFTDIPPWYRRVEYLESSGTQYIVTDLVPTFQVGDSMNVNFALLSTTPNTSIIFGCNGTALAYNIAVQLPYIAASGLRCDPAGLKYFGKPTFGKEYVWTSNGLTIGTSLNATTYQANEAVQNNVKPLVLFAQTDTGRTPAHCRISEVSYLSNYDEAVCVLLPCVRDDGAAGMYDVVSGKFYTNVGTGTFVTGAFI